MATLKNNQFTLNQTNIIKGIGILLIVLHNFYHTLPPILGENEFSFSNKIFLDYKNSFESNPGSFFRIFFSYFGHLGVQIFIFFSAYGLTRKYENEEINYFEFLNKRISKIPPNAVPLLSADLLQERGVSSFWCLG